MRVVLTLHSVKRCDEGVLTLHSVKRCDEGVLTLHSIMRCDEVEGVSRLLQDNATEPHVGWALGSLHSQHAALKFCLQHLLTCYLHRTRAAQAVPTHTV